MAKFRKVPVVIEATRWFQHGDHPSVIAIPDAVWCVIDKRSVGLGLRECGWIDTLEGGHIVSPGDWIITGVKGEMYPCKPDIFAATYEEVV